MARMSNHATGFFSDFKAFLMQGNVVDLAVAVIIGAAFGKIIESLMTDIITPVLLSPALKAAGVDNIQAWAPNGIKVGVFLAAVLNFVVVAFVVFSLIRTMQAAKNRLARAEALAEPEVDAVLAVQEKLAVSVDRLANALDRQQLG
ncbi:MAG: large conductance mechanosensitive channel protein MscL [Synechococcales cyanobacterium CRU_2_2]|nr:large conductance mechanosensitive channel protein MscL [Synechococcales cyanobacterium CRU_2_2]